MFFNHIKKRFRIEILKCDECLKRFIFRYRIGTHLETMKIACVLFYLTIVRNFERIMKF